MAAAAAASLCGYYYHSCFVTNNPHLLCYRAAKQAFSFLAAPKSSSPFSSHHHQLIKRFRCRVTACAVGSDGDSKPLTSPTLVALEYADLNLPSTPYREVGHVRTRQHVNPLSSSKRLVKRAELWVKELALSNIHFLHANATVSFREMVVSYTGPLMIVSILCPDPHFKKKHHKRRVVRKPLVDDIINNLAPGGKVFVQSDVLDVALDMRDQFDAESNALVHVNEFDRSMLCDDDGWLLNNPMGIRTEREIHAEFEGAKIYRRLYQKRA
ncbi:hypothetical protein Tsubulata_036579 [Turnera subulata]|uniref:tRNA (guanine(46)-N(7))-methyltransferase n=1 Tax=Turnera subulata TaxID=218843 RepID=A0A9Q0JLI6_9ROSI|nr:hypothetical protein Tsubulata_036579 [Turnera subulata]